MNSDTHAKTVPFLWGTADDTPGAMICAGKDARGAPPVKVDVARLVALTTQSKPEAATHWSTRKMAAALGVSAASVSRHWRRNGLKPHLVRGFKVSRDPMLVGTREALVGPCIAPPAHTRTAAFDAEAGEAVAGVPTRQTSRIRLNDTCVINGPPQTSGVHPHH